MTNTGVQRSLSYSAELDVQAKTKPTKLTLCCADGAAWLMFIYESPSCRMTAVF